MAVALGLPLLPARLASAASPSATTTVISKSSAPDNKQGPFDSGSPSESADGRFTAFVSANDLDATHHSSNPQVYVRDRAAGKTKWVSDVPTLPGGPEFYSAFQPSVSRDGRFVAFTARPADLSLQSVQPPKDRILIAGQTQSLLSLSPPTAQPAADESLAVQGWATGQKLTLQVADSAGRCLVGFGGPPALGTERPPRLPPPAVTMTLQSSSSACGALKDQLVIQFTNSGSGTTIIPITGITYRVAAGASLGPVLVKTNPPIIGSGTAKASNGEIIQGDNTISAARPIPTIGRCPSACSGPGSDWKIHLTGWGPDTRILIQVSDAAGASCTGDNFGLTGGVAFLGQPTLVRPTQASGASLGTIAPGGTCTFDNELLLDLGAPSTAAGDFVITGIQYQVAAQTYNGPIRVNTSVIEFPSRDEVFGALTGQDAASNATIVTNRPLPQPGLGSVSGSVGPPPPPPPQAPLDQLETCTSGTEGGGPSAAGLCQVYLRDVVAQTTQLVSAADGTATPGDRESSQPAITADGNQIAFTSKACDLTTERNKNCQDSIFRGEIRLFSTEIYVRDVSKSSTVMVSTDVNDREVICQCRGSVAPSISATGRLVAFESNDRLNPAGSNDQIYVHDREVAGSGPLDQTGLGRTNTRLASARPNPLAGVQRPTQPSISGDGRLVAFVTSDQLVVPAGPSQSVQVYVHDRNIEANIDLLSVSGPAPSDPTQSWTFQFDEPLGAPGTKLTPTAAAKFELIGSAGSSFGTTTAVGLDNTTAIVTFPAGLDPSTVARGASLPGAVSFPPAVPNPLLTADAKPSNPPGGSASPAPVAAGPTLVAVGPSPAAPQSAVRFTFDGPVTGAVPNLFEVFDGQGRTSKGSAVVPVAGDTAAVDVTFTHEQLMASVGADVRAGAVTGGKDAQLLAPYQPFNVLASQGPKGPGDGFSSGPSISVDGRTVAFSSTSTNLAGTPARPYQANVYTHDLASGDTQLLSVSTAGTPPADGNSYRPSTSGDGRFTAFQSNASNLDVDTNGPVSDAFLSDRFPVLAITPAPGTFGPVQVGLGGQMTFTVTNSGGGAAVLGPMSASFGGPNPADFIVASDSCSGVTLYATAPGNTCTVTIAFSPAVEGFRMATLQVASDAPANPATDPLSGTGTIPGLALSPVPVDFGAVALGSNRTATITATDTGTAPTKISSVGVSPGDFSVVTDGCSMQTVQPGKSCQVILQFAPTAPGSRTTMFSINDNAPGSPQTDPLSGTGTVPALTLSPLPADFGVLPVGSTSVATITATDTGQAPATISSLAITGANAGDFSIATDGCTAKSLDPGNSCLVTLKFAPTAGGGRSALFSVNDNVANSPQTDPLSGIGTVPGLALSPIPVAFGTVQPGSNATATITATDNGQAPVKISSIGVSGANAGDFAVVTDACSTKTLAPNGSCQMTLRFGPAAAGNRSALLSVNDTAAGSPHTDPLAGTQLAPSIVPTPGNPTPGNPTPGDPRLRLQPTLGPPGSLVTVIGTGWVKNQPVVLSWNRGLDGKPFPPPTADANGSFVVVLAIFHHDFLGFRLAVASQAAIAGPGNGSPQHPVMQQFLAVPGTSEPPGFLLRR